MCYDLSKAMSGSKQCLVLRRGLTDYLDGWEMQRQAAAAVGQGRSPHVLILLQHPPTYTLGVRAKAEHLLASEEALARLGARVYRVDRGGDVTFHGPGQIVGYPIFRLGAWRQGALWYVRGLEAALIDALAALGIAAGRVEGRPGVWVGPDRPPSGGAAKVAAIGVRISRGVTSHGFALNVSTDLSYFGHIVPCGLADATVTSIERLLRRPVPVWEVEDLLIASLGRVFGLEMVEAKAEALATTQAGAGGA
jgi:lipoyl(octanoyl) transferase